MKNSLWEIELIKTLPEIFMIAACITGAILAVIGVIHLFNGDIWED